MGIMGRASLTGKIMEAPNTELLCKARCHPLHTLYTGLQPHKDERGFKVIVYEGRQRLKVNGRAPRLGARRTCAGAVMRPCNAGQIWVLVRLRCCGLRCISGSGVGSGCETVR